MTGFRDKKAREKEDRGDSVVVLCL